MGVLQIFRYLFGVPVVVGAVWVLARPGKPVKGWVAAALLLYGFVYVVVFHYGLKAF